jgi:hypothetical protein
MSNVIELVPKNIRARPCSVCGASMENDAITYEWENVRVCELCLRDGQDAINERLKGSELEGRLVVPSWEECLAADSFAWSEETVVSGT